MKTSPLGTEFLYGDRQTNMTKQILTFRSFVNVPRSLLTIRATADCLVRNKLERHVYVRLLSQIFHKRRGIYSSAE